MAAPPPADVGDPCFEGSRASPSPTILSAGIVAHNEERNLERAVRSLLDQELPPDTVWHTLWIVASGCTDRTTGIAERLAKEDSRIRVLVEPQRMGKAHALREVLQRAHGTALVLLNADARAEPGAVASLLRVGLGHTPPFAVMARPVVRSDSGARWSEELRLMWSLHHEFHLELQQLGGGAQLSDELILLSLPSFPPLPDGIINDGSYFGVWLSQHGGHRLYAPEAWVTIETPRRLRDHLSQRRRINVGNEQITAVLGAAPTTLAGYALRRPGPAFGVVRRSIRAQRNGFLRFGGLALTEIAAKGLAIWDRLPPAKDHVRWRRIEVETPHEAMGSAPSLAPHAPAQAAIPPTSLDRRVASLVEVGDRFGTGVPLEGLVGLLPRDAPASPLELERWLRERPGLGRIDEGRRITRDASPRDLARRQQRGSHYREVARLVVEEDLRQMLPWIRCAGITGSTAYGEPEEGDDIDFFVVTRTGVLWLFLAYTYVALRWKRTHRGTPVRPDLCFNYILDDSHASREFTENQGFLFAREALSTQMIWGEEYYRGLLGSAPWIGEEIPRVYQDRSRSERPSTASFAPPALRLLNASLFPWLAFYLQLVGLRRNHRLRRQGRLDALFATHTTQGGLAYTSQRFETLRKVYLPSQGAESSSGTTHPSRTQGSRWSRPRGRRSVRG